MIARSTSPTSRNAVDIVSTNVAANKRSSGPKRQSAKPVIEGSAPIDWTRHLARTGAPCVKNPLKQVCESEVDLSKDANPAKPETLDPLFRENLQHYDERGPRVGDRAPEFTLKNLDGDTVRLSDVLKEKPVVLVTGSVSCTVFRRFALPQVEQLRRDFGKDVEVLVLYVDEAHPALGKSAIAKGQWTHKENVTDGILVRRPETAEARRVLALLAAERFGLATAGVVMDTPDNTTWDAYLHLPNASYVIGKDGKVAFREAWAFRTNGKSAEPALHEFVEAMTQR